MESINLFNIGPNDDLAEVIRKCNYNFRNYSKASFGNVGQTDHDGDLSNLIRQVEDLKKDLDNLRKSSVPPIGSWIYCDFDPNEQWDNTKWEKYDEGYFIMSAGKSHKSGEKYGSKTKSIPLPNHEHIIGIGELGKNMYIAATEPKPDSGLNGWGWHALGTQTSSLTTQTAVTFNQSNSYMRFRNKIGKPSIPDNSKTVVQDDPSIDITPQSIALPLWHRVA